MTPYVTAQSVLIQKRLAADVAHEITVVLVHVLVQLDEVLENLLADSASVSIVRQFVRDQAIAVTIIERPAVNRPQVFDQVIQSIEIIITYTASHIGNINFDFLIAFQI